MKDFHFPCSACGECCKHISHITELAKFDNGKGVCIHLNTDKSCAIYLIRPSICQVGYMYFNHYQTQFSQDEFIEMNRQACNEMQQLADIPVEFRV